MVVIDLGLKLRYALHWIDLFVLKMTLNRSLIDKFTPKIDKRNLTIQPYDTDMIPYDNIWLSSKAKENEKKVQLKYCQIIPGWVSNNFYQASLAFQSFMTLARIAYCSPYPSQNIQCTYKGTYILWQIESRKSQP